MAFRRLLALGTALLGASVLSGCLVLASQTATQIDVIGAVKLTSTICASDADQSDHTGCTRRGNQDSDAEAGQYQLLVAYRVPSGSNPESAPTTISTGPTGGGSLALTESASYTAQLELLKPAGGGRKWLGFLSEPIDYQPAGPSEQAITLAIYFSLPATATADPFAGPFNYRTVVGYREVTPSLPADRPVQCGEPVVQTGPATTNCVSDPDAASLDTDLGIQTRDLKISGNGPVTVQRGQTASLTFSLRFAGEADPDANFALSAGTTLPGASATPSISAWEPASDDSSSVDVLLDVPADAAGGIYEVRLIAALPNGQQRSMTRQIKISLPAAPPPVPMPSVAPPPADLTPPVLSGLAVSPKKFIPTSRSVASAGTGSKTKFSLDEPATVEITLNRVFRGRLLGTRCVRSTRRNRRLQRCSKLVRMGELLRQEAPAGNNLLPFEGWFLGRRLKPESYRLIAAATDAAGNRSAARGASFTIAKR